MAHAVTLRARFRREDWGTCDGEIGNTSHPGRVERCNRKASYVSIREDEDGNHPRYCADCARAA